MSDHPIRGMMDTTLQKIREMVDTSTVIGDPIVSGGVTVIPVSKISYGFASGGSDLPSKQEGDFFGGGGGAGVTVTPVAFVVINGSDVQLLQISDQNNTANKIVDAMPDIIDKLRDAFKKDNSIHVRPVSED